MNFSAIVSYLGRALLLLAVAAIAPMIASLLERDISGAISFAFAALLMGFLGGGLYYASHRENRDKEASGLREIILVLLAWWLIVPIFAGLPFVLEGMSFVDGWYEAVSAMTTTGAWINAAEARASDGGMLWRAVLQSLGGLVSLAAAAAVFVRPQFLGVTTVTPPFSLGGETAYLHTFNTALRSFFPIYIALSLFAAISISIAGAPAIDALVMGLSLMASGGFIPKEGGLAAYQNSVLIFPVFLTMVLSGVNFILIVRIADQRARLRDLREKETRLFIIFILLVGILYWISTDSRNLALLPMQIFNAASVLSTNGFTMGVSPELVPVLVTAVIGGSAVSTAGGIKIIRWIITFGRARQELWKLVHPHGVQSETGTANELAVWIHFIAFTMLLALMVLMITIFGNSLELAVTGAVAVISNAGPLINLAPGSFNDYGIFNSDLRVILALGMVLGRMELVVLLALFNRTFWLR
jgi:trk/ktr system potassium uptake protein